MLTVTPRVASKGSLFTVVPSKQLGQPCMPVSVPRGDVSFDVIRTTVVVIACLFA